MAAVARLFAGNEANAIGSTARLASLLIEKGAAVNAGRQDGRTILMSAVMVGWPKMVALLLQHHAGVHARDAQGHVAMDYVHPLHDPEIGQMLRGAARNRLQRSGRVVCDAQDRLGELGYGVNSQDCWWGSGNATTEALRRFQRDHAIAATEQLDDASAARISRRAALPASRSTYISSVRASQASA